MKVKYLIEELSQEKKLYVLYKALEGTNSLTLTDWVGKNFRDVIEYTRTLLKEVLVDE